MNIFSLEERGRERERERERSPIIYEYFLFGRERGGERGREGHCLMYIYTCVCVFV